MVYLWSTIIHVNKKIWYYSNCNIGARIMKRFISIILCSMLMCTNIPVFAATTDAGDSRTEHLALPHKLAKESPINAVDISGGMIKILPYNTMQLTFAEPFNSKNAVVGDKIIFLMEEGLRTYEGTYIFPPGTRYIAEITKIERPKSFNRCGKIYLNFKYIELPDGTQYNANGKLFSKKDFLSRGKLNALGKGLGSTLAGVGVGIGAGCGIGVAAGEVIIGGFAIGLPIGFAIGATIGLVTPGLYYKANAGDKVNVQIIDEVDVLR